MNIKKSLTAFALGLAFVLVTASPAYAMDSTEPQVSDDNGYLPKTTLTEAQKKELEAKKLEYQKQLEAKKAEYKAEAQKKTEELKKQAQEKATEAKKQANEKHQELRSQTCEKKQALLNERISKTSKASEEFLTRFDGFNAKIDKFVQNKNLNSQDFADLQKAVDDAQAQAVASIAALKSLKPIVDCKEIDSTTQNVTNYRDQIKSTRESLQAYKKSLVNLLTAVVTSFNNSQKTNDSTDDSSDANSDANNGGTN